MRHDITDRITDVTGTPVILSLADQSYPVVIVTNAKGRLAVYNEEQIRQMSDELAKAKAGIAIYYSLTE